MRFYTLYCRSVEYRIHAWDLSYGLNMQEGVVLTAITLVLKY